MRRASLLTVAALGLLVSILGGSGLFAALTDTADLGPNNVDSAPLPPSADIRLAYWTGVGCAAFSDNLTTGFLSKSGITPGPFGDVEAICMQNIGSQPVSVSVMATNLVDVDVECTGDEAENGDLTCGGLGQGELANALQLTFYEMSCDSPGPPAVIGGAMLSALTSSPFALGSLAAAGGYACYQFVVVEPESVPAVDQQLAQSDAVTWTFRFTGTATP